MKDLMIISLLSFTTAFIFIGFSFAFYVLFKLFIEIAKGDKKNSSCKWVKKDDHLDQEYKTSCGSVFYDSTESGDPVTDWLTYCPYCSLKVKKPSN